MEQLRVARGIGTGVGTAYVGMPSISVAGRTHIRRGGPVFLRDGFRPFYLGGAIFAALAVPLWLGMWYHGFFTPSLPGLLWHMHEMVFGFAGAIIVGFLFTAARNWTGLPLPAGVQLGALFALWIAGRLGMFFAYGPATAVVDSLLLVIVTAVLGRKFILAGSMASMPLCVVLSTLATANMAFHAAMHDMFPLAPMTMAEFGLVVVVLVEMIVGGRVVPGFTANTGVRQWRSKTLARAAFGFAAAAFVADAVHAPGAWTGTLALAAGLLAGVQAIGWNPLAARSRPMQWVLHVGYAWIPVGLVLLGLSAFGIVARSAAIHAFAAGSMGVLIMGMITRTALGHSGREVRAGRCEVVLFVLVIVAAACRVMAALVPGFYLVGISISGLAWMAAFTWYSVAYAPLLLGFTPRHARGVAAAGA